MYLQNVFCLVILNHFFSSQPEYVAGLDPAGPGYGDLKDHLKLDPLDAKMVDVVHTFMRVIGVAKPCGYVDFYPNGGRYQPGCPDITSCQCCHFAGFFPLKVV